MNWAFVSQDKVNYLDPNKVNIIHQLIIGINRGTQKYQIKKLYLSLNIVGRYEELRCCKSVLKIDI